MRHRPLPIRLLIPALAAAGVLAAAPAASAFGGAALTSPRVGLTWNGTAFPRVKCAGGTDGFCVGRITILRAGRVLGSVPFSVRSNDAPTVEVPLPPKRGGRRGVILASGRSVTVVIRARDLSYEWVTTRSRAYLASG